MYIHVPSSLNHGQQSLTNDCGTTLASVPTTETGKHDDPMLWDALATWWKCLRWFNGVSRALHLTIPGSGRSLLKPCKGLDGATHHHHKAKESNWFCSIDILWLGTSCEQPLRILHSRGRRKLLQMRCSLNAFLRTSWTI